MAALMVDTTEDRAKRLRHAKLVATGAVLVAAAGFFLAHLLPVPSFWQRLIASAGEAGTVGGLADWFAVTALFRHPLGLPIPHTALIPSRKDDIARSLARFIEEHFLDPAPLMARLQESDRAAEFGAWLARPETSRFVAEKLVGLLRPLIRSGAHLSLIDALLPALRWLNDGLAPVLANAVGKRTGWLVPGFVDREIAGAARKALSHAIEALGRPGSAERVAVDTWLRHRFEEMPEDLRATAAQVWRDLQTEISEGERLIEAVAGLVARLGSTIAQSPELRATLNAGLETAVRDYIAPWREQIGGYIAGVVARWDPRQVTRIVELQVGRDLQYVRLNGTLIGALIGVGLYLANWGLGLR
jgi:uncharacterized membrane-anchored protein YjiN (DUF445 family)